MAKEVRKILIVDDNATDAAFLQRNLEKLGVHIPVELFGSGPEVIEYLREVAEKKSKGISGIVEPAILFLDLKLGNLSGLEVLQWITAQPALRRMLVIIHSGIATPRDIDALYAAGANSFLRKANDLEELRGLVDYFKGHFSGS